MDRNELLELLRQLNQSQFKVLLFQLRYPADLLPTKASQLEQAIEIIQYYEQPGRSIDQLAKAVQATLGASPAAPNTTQAEEPGRLSQSLLRELHTTLIQLGLHDIRVLTTGLPAQYTASVPLNGPPSAQLLTLLHHANEEGSLMTGQSPLLHIVQTAATLAYPRMQSTFLEEVAARIRVGT